MHGLRRVGALVGLCLVPLLVSCGGSSSDAGRKDSPAETRRFCGVLEEWANLERKVENDDGGASPELLADYDRLIELATKKLPAAAPDSIAEDVAVIMAIPPDAVLGRDARERAAADKRLAAYVRDECDLTQNPLKGMDFSE